MAEAQCVVLGGGFGGIAAARRLRERLGERARVTLVDRRSHFVMGLRLLWAAAGLADLDAGRRPLAALERRGVRVVQDEVVGLDLDRRAVALGSGTRLAYDGLIVALGAELRPDEVPGYDPTGSSLYDPEQTPAIAARLAAITGGRVGIGILGVPYKCPPAPYEAAFLVDDLLRRRGVRAAVAVEVFTPQPMALPVAGRDASRMVEQMLAEREIAFFPGRPVQGIEAREVVFAGERRAYDLLLGVAPHRAPRVLAQAGLLAGAWVRPDPETCATAAAGVYAVGDVTEIPLANGMMLPKAGVFAEAQGVVAADHLAAWLGGPPPEHRFDGVGVCFVEAGGGRAVAMRGRFFASPEPAVAVEAPSERALDEKRGFEADRLAAWF